MNPNTNKNPLIIGLSVISIILLVIVIVLATRKKSEAPAPIANTTTQTPVKAPTTVKRTPPKASSITGESGTPTETGSSTLVNEESDAYVNKVTKTSDGKYLVELDYIDWEYNADLAISTIVNKDQKIRKFELAKDAQLSYTTDANYPAELDRREVFLYVVAEQNGGPDLYHVAIKDGKIVSVVEIYQGK